jgi:hypothetical protein
MASARSSWPRSSDETTIACRSASTISLASASGGSKLEKGTTTPPAIQVPTIKGKKFSSVLVNSPIRPPRGMRDAASLDATELLCLVRSSYVID